MQTLSLTLDDDLDAALDVVCAERGRPKCELVVEVLDQYLGRFRRTRALQNTSLRALYEALSSDDLALAETGMNDYCSLLSEADRA